MTRHEAQILQTVPVDIENGHPHIAAAKVKGLLTAAEREFAAEDRHNDWAELADETSWQKVA